MKAAEHPQVRELGFQKLCPQGFQEGPPPPSPPVGTKPHSCLDLGQVDRR